MTLFPRLLLTAAGLVMASSTAIAADYDPPVFVQEAPEYVPVEVGSGWYLRGDVSYNANRSPYDIGDSTGVDSSSRRFGGSLGVGYHFSDLIRGDIELGMISHDKISFGAPLLSGEFKNEVYTGMANAYFDLGTIAGFTPYVGGGVGIMHTRDTFDLAGLDDLKDKQSEFAYALMTGVSYKVSTNTSVDLGYRYLSSPGTEFVNLRTSGAEIEKGLDYHQVRVGLRYDLW
jgi:opacity protein-like surface antigen